MKYSQILKEPLVHFLLLGGALFLLYSFLNKDEERPEDFTIHIAQSDIDRLTSAYEKNWSTSPDSATLDLLIKDEVKTEMLYREALRMNLDHNDEIIRRRLKQKYEFLVKDLVSLEQASEATLETFYKENIDRYNSSKKISFSQIYFSPDKRAAPLQEAELMYQQIKNQSFPNDLNGYGDNFHLPNYFANKDVGDIRQALGKQFADAIFTIKNIGWSVPISSGYGAHLVWVHSINDSNVLPFSQVKEQVAQDWEQEQQTRYNDQLYKNLSEQYKVTYSFERREQR